MLIEQAIDMWNDPSNLSLNAGCETLVLDESGRVDAVQENGNVVVCVTEQGRATKKDDAVPPLLWQITVSELVDRAIAEGYVDPKYRDDCIAALSSDPEIEGGAYQQNGNMRVVRSDSIFSAFQIPVSCYVESVIAANIAAQAKQKQDGEVRMEICGGLLFAGVILFLIAKGKIRLPKRKTQAQQQGSKPHPFMVREKPDESIIAESEVIPGRAITDYVAPDPGKAQQRRHSRRQKEWQKEQIRIATGGKPKK